MSDEDYCFAKWGWQAKDVGEVTFDKGKNKQTKTKGKKQKINFFPSSFLISFLSLKASA
jgi:hypothetical protein